MKALKIVFIFILMIGCNYHKLDRENITLINKSNDSVYCILSINDSVKTLNHYSGFPKKLNNYFYTFKVIAPDSTSKPNDRPEIWSELMNQSKNGKMRLFIIEKKLVDKNGWKAVLSENIYTRKYEFNIDDLDKIDWKVRYNN